jgi:hypothetical protein
VRILVVLTLLAAVACSQSPTAPTPAGATAAQLRWDVTASSCAPVAPPSPLPDLAASSIEPQADGSVMASWPYTVKGRQAMLTARFVREGGAWAMCSWDTTDV